MNCAYTRLLCELCPDAPPTRHLQPRGRRHQRNRLPRLSVTMSQTSASNPPILLFYADFGEPGPPSLLTPVKRSLRRSAKLLTNRPSVTGFEMWTRLLVRSLRSQGRTVRLNDYKTAQRQPDYPVGVTGYPQILSWWDLPNPAILGPGLFDHPAINPTLMDDVRFRHYIVTCEWMRALFEPFYGPKVIDWHAGIDTVAWTDTRALPKTYDCLVYDKIRWDREVLVPAFLEPIELALAERGLRYTVLRYGQHSPATYRRLLSQSRFMLFLCEHETQGLAYQEAMASNLPILAWNPGFWVDPNRSRYADDPVPASSTPYFGAECGLQFGDLDEFYPAIDRFLASLDRFEPRLFVQRELSLATSARRYTHFYDAIAKVGGAGWTES
jgi:hypothetical protein